MAKIHKQHEFHGATQLKNLTYQNENVYFIDFEESFDTNIGIRELQFRDLFLFLFSLSKEQVTVDYEKLIRSYIVLTNNSDFIERFHKLIKKVSLLMRIIENKTVWKMLDKDTKSVYKLLKILKNIQV